MLDIGRFPSHTKVFFILQDPCPAGNAETECLSQVSLGAVYPYSSSQMFSTGSIGPRISKTFELAGKSSGGDIMEWYSGKPKVFIYCTPCLRMIELAIDLTCDGNIPRSHYYYDVEIRVDCRLRASCCSLSEVKEKLTMLNNTLYDDATSYSNPTRARIWSDLVDTRWTEKQIKEADELYSASEVDIESFLIGHSGNDNCAAIILFTESPTFRCLFAGRESNIREPTEGNQVYWLRETSIEGTEKWTLSYFGRM